MNEGGLGGRGVEERVGGGSDGVKWTKREGETGG